MKALVTGGTGFIGSHIVRELNKGGHRARVLHRKSSKLTALEEVEFESAIGDILDMDSLLAASEGCDWVFHVAAVADYWRAEQSQMFEANVEGTRRVLEAAKRVGVKRVVFTSSAAAVGQLPNGQPADETVAFNLPPSEFPYGYSKVLAERVVHDAVAAGQDVVIVNPVVVMGPADLNMISGSFITQVKQFGRFTPISSGGLSVVDVRDVARWQVLAAEQGQTGERYILGAANYDYTQWFAMIAEVVGVPRPFFRAPNFILPFVATAVDMLRRYGIQTPVDADQVRLGGRDVYFDCRKAWEAFGKPEIDMMQSLDDTYEWYRGQGLV
jgi:dihydroflavonol-4-reductase